MLTIQPGGRDDVAARSHPSAWDLLTLGASNAVVVVAGIGLGWLVDHALGTLPVFILVGLGLGIVAAILITYRRIRPYLS
jgi:F0F1-type ATP synthase assembly protein I